jgi:hypothetical protein
VDYGTFAGCGDFLGFSSVSVTRRERVRGRNGKEYRLDVVRVEKKSRY